MIQVGGFGHIPGIDHSHRQVRARRVKPTVFPIQVLHDGQYALRQARDRPGYLNG